MEYHCIVASSKQEKTALDRDLTDYVGLTLVTHDLDLQSDHPVRAMVMTCLRVKVQDQQSVPRIRVETNRWTDRTDGWRRLHYLSHLCGW